MVDARFTVAQRSRCAQLSRNHGAIHGQVRLHFWPSLYVGILRFLHQRNPFRFSQAKPSLHTADIKPHHAVACFSSALGFDEDYLVTANDPTHPDCISQLRLLHYPATDNASGTWRAGAHTDIGCLTLLFQRDNQDGLEICTGRESHTGFNVGDSFTPIPAHTGPIVVNVGDMLSTKKPQSRDSPPKHKKVAANSPLPHSDSGVVR